MFRVLSSITVLSALLFGYPNTISDVKSQYYSIEQNIKNGNYTMVKKSQEYDNTGADFTAYRDRHNTIRKLIVETGSEDSYHKAEYSYTDSGSLLFTYNEDNNVAGCSTTIRSYYSGTKVLKRASKVKKCDISYHLPFRVDNPNKVIDNPDSFL